MSLTVFLDNLLAQNEWIIVEHLLHIRFLIVVTCEEMVKPLEVQAKEERAFVGLMDIKPTKERDRLKQAPVVLGL